MGDSLSVLDIAWLIYAHRLSLGGYPFARLHPRVAAWMEKLRARPDFAKEIAMPPEAVTRLEATRRSQVEAGKTLEAVRDFRALFSRPPLGNRAAAVTRRARDAAVKMCWRRASPRPEWPPDG